MMRRLCVALLCLLPTAPAAAQDVTDRLAPVAARGMADWQVPGIAIAIVRDGRPAESRTWGVRDVARTLPVTPRTGFGLGSITKTMTAAVIDDLAMAGKLGWDAPVTRLLPDLRFGSEELTNRASLRDLMSHRTGMARHDALWYFGVYGTKALMDRLRFLPPAAPYHSTYQYTNLLPAIAGFAAAAADGRDWAGMMRVHLLRPLGMLDTVLSLPAFKGSPEPATGYYPADTGREPIPLRDTDAIAPAAAAYAAIGDAARFLARLVRDPPVELRRKSSDRPNTSRSQAFRITGYGAGLYIGTFRDAPIHWHWGVIDGFGNILAFRPDSRDGVVVLSNLSGRNPVPTMLALAAFDALDGRDPAVWPDLYGARPAPVEKPPATCPATDGMAHPRADYVGAYEHPAYGRAEIVTEPDDLLVLHMHGRAVRMDGCGGDVWMVRDGAWPIRAGLNVRFTRDPSGKVDALEAAIADGPTYRLNPGPLRFPRQPVAR
jgi:CubicO group peptidase (beta-lactamase class C family)